MKEVIVGDSDLKNIEAIEELSGWEEKSLIIGEEFLMDEVSDENCGPNGRVKIEDPVGLSPY